LQAVLNGPTDFQHGAIFPQIAALDDVSAGFDVADVRPGGYEPATFGRPSGLSLS
jgi:hypothetical protein